MGQTRAGGAAWGELWGGCPLPGVLGDLRERRELPSGVRGKAPAANTFSSYSRPQNTSHRKFSSMTY